MGEVSAFAWKTSLMKNTHYGIIDLREAQVQGEVQMVQALGNRPAAGIGPPRNCSIDSGNTRLWNHALLASTWNRHPSRAICVSFSPAVLILVLI